MNKELYQFLIEAKKQTYANANVEKQKSSRKGSHDYEYSSNNMIYHDTYFGGTNFMGEEVVTLDESLSESAVDNALRPALMKVGEEDIIPVRGPKEFINGEYKYTFEVNGDLENFDGVETIYKGTKKVYILKCHGGKIKR